MMTFEEWLERPPDYREAEECPSCGEIRPCRRYYRGTAYLDDEMNYNYGCEECEKNERQYWEERWQDYYSGRL